MPTPENRRARQRASLAMLIGLLLAGGIGILLLPIKLPLLARVLLAAGDFVVALTLFAVLRQNRSRP